MDKLQQYRQIIRQVLTDQAHPYSHSSDVEAEVICDTEHDHYQLAYIGWENQKRVFNLILHFDIKDGKIWVQYNGTETPIAQVLTANGVAASDIVLLDVQVFQNRRLKPLFFVDRSMSAKS